MSTTKFYPSAALESKTILEWRFWKNINVITKFNNSNNDPNEMITYFKEDNL